MYHPFFIDDIVLLWSHCADYPMWMSQKEKILIWTFLFQGILQFSPFLREFTSWCFSRYCFLFLGFKREEISPSKCILADLTKIDLNSTQVSHESCWWWVASDVEYWAQSEQKFFLPWVAREVETPWCGISSWELSLSL